MTRVRETYTLSPKNLTKRASVGLQVPQKTVWNILRKPLRKFPYRLQLLQNLTENDKILRHSFCMGLQQRNEMFYVSGMVHKHNVRIWGTENRRVIVEHMRDSPKVNVFCAVSRKMVYPCKFQGLLFKPYLILSQLVSTQILHQMFYDLHHYVTSLLALPLIRLVTSQERLCSIDLFSSFPFNIIFRYAFRSLTSGPIAWPPRSPDLTPLDFFLWAYVKHTVYQVKMNDLQHLKARIRDAVAAVTRNMIQTWIFVVPSREPTLKFIEKVIYSEKNFDSFPL
ncbi:hypothetical protein B7P43_G00323 [Cryptotermes secundus]|uniref:Uncharacterized protein n=1 Tax=Cryptotermes secundus TaxID=105785 RepID=A0A2J7PWI6_9NEOP|nr:hypothetical protein B7P43_G00323 [Cryptotermes secundus]